MDVVTGALGSLLPKLFKLLGDEYKLQTGMKEKVKFLTEELKSIQAFLLKLGAVPWDELDKQVQVWASEAREASYDMEDILDTFFVCVEARGPAHPSRLKRAMNKLENLFSKGKARHDIGCAIKNMKNRLQEVADRRNRYKIDDIVVNPAATSTVDPRLKAMYKEVASLVGIEEPSKNLISKMSIQGDDMSQRKKIVAIVGIGGLGKTTLAKAVYDKLRAKFDCTAFVPVGRNPNLTKVLADILYELDKNKYSDLSIKNRDPRQLIDNLHDFLEDKRYLIVIDDIWENKSWEETLELALLENNRGSRIIITTRNVQVATKVGAQVYKMQPLSYDSSKKLFYTRISGDDMRCTDYHPTEISNQILKKCGGVPLAIITIASLLVGKPRERWSDVFTSIGFGNKDDTQVENTTKILSYSYYDMPAHLRTCLLYLSIFPEDYTIDKETLIWKWIAEGFVQGKQGKSWLFQLGEQYFNDLVNRSMVQAKENEITYMVDGCQVHDMVLDLIRSISVNENFVSILDNDEGTLSLPPCSARRLAHHDNIMVHTAQGNMMDMPQVRSFIAIKCAFGNWVPLSGFKVIRVLEISGCKHVKTSHLVHLGNLVHLRYLGLERTPVDKLPNEIGALKLLQILNINRTDIRELTPSISRLTQLVCLKCDLLRMAPQNWIGKLSSLEELKIGVVIGKEEEEEDNGSVVLKELGNLKELRVFRCLFKPMHGWFVKDEMDDNKQRDLVLSLNNMHKLQHLEFDNSGWTIQANIGVWEDAGFVLPRHVQFIDVSVFRFSRLPSCFSSVCLPYLTHLSLWVDAMDEKGLESLGRLPELCYLSLSMKSTTTMSNISKGNGYFQKLKSCKMFESMIQFECKDDDSTVSFHIWNGIDAMPFGSGTKNSSFSASAVMPNLEKIRFCIFVRALNNGDFGFGNTSLQYLPSLQYAKVYIKCAGASAAEVNEAEAALTNATEVHPNRPELVMRRLKEYKMISTVQREKKKKEHRKKGKGKPTADDGASKSGIVISY